MTFSRSTLLLFTFISFYLISESTFATNTIDSLQLNHQGIHIISEENHITIHGSTDILIQFNKKVRYKIWNSAGLKRLKKYSLPEIHDPTFIRHAPKKRNLQDLYSSLKVKSFTAHKIKVNGDKLPIQLNENVENVEMVLGDRYETFKRFNYELQSLQSGDLVEISYEYTIPFQENSLDFLSYRYFFNGDYFKEKFNLSLSHKKGVKVDVYTANNAKYDSSFIDQNIKVYQWERSQLPGNIHEENARPYMELPYIIIGVQPSELTYRVPNSAVDEFIPKYSIYAALRERNDLDMIRAIDNGVKLKDFNLINRFYEQHTTDLAFDTTQLNKLRNLKRLIAEDFEFEDDVSFFRRENNYDKKIGAHLNEFVLGDRSRYEAYVALVRTMKFEYFTAYVSDNRSGITDDKFLKSMQCCDYMIAPILKDGTIHYILPKNQNFGYYLDELPFYYENTLVRLVHMGDYSAYKEKISNELRQIKLPLSLPKDNLRRANVLAQVNLNSNIIDFQAIVDLSGQFSTMTRGVYENKGYYDPTINPLYHKKLWEVDSSAIVSHSEWLSKNDVSPFKAKLRLNYQAKKLLRPEKDTIQIPIRTLFDHIMPSQICKFERSTAYYSDFIGADTYTYVFTFDKNIQLLNDKQLKISNDFGEYIFSLEQLSDQSIKLTTYLMKLQYKTPVNQFEQLCEIHEAIEQSKKLSIQLIEN